MDYFKAISEVVFTSSVNGEPLIGYNNGLIIMVLLFVIYWCLIRDKRRKKKLLFPRFCDDCLFLLHLNGGLCRKECKYHPLHKNSPKTYYRKKTS